MHTRGRPEERRSPPPIGDSVPMVKRELRQWAEAATLAGIKRDRLVLDPGFGFGKRFEENYPLLAHFAELQQMGFPLLAGDREVIYRENAGARWQRRHHQRLYGTLAAERGWILKGAHIIRTTMCDLQWRRHEWQMRLWRVEDKKGNTKDGLPPAVQASADRDGLLFRPCSQERGRQVSVAEIPISPGFQSPLACTVVRPTRKSMPAVHILAQHAMPMS